MEYLKRIPEVKYEGPKSNNPMAFKHYDPEFQVEGKTMAEHLRFAVCFWHTWRGNGSDMFGESTFERQWEMKEEKLSEIQKAIVRVKLNFEFCKRLKIKYYCFHDADIAPRGKTIKESNQNLDKVVKVLKVLQKETGVKLLWNTSNLFSGKQYMCGAGTNPELKIFALACARTRKSLDIAKELGAENFVFWGGREGYMTLLNTDLKKELDHYALFLKMAVAYKKKIGFKGTFLVEPKPREPTKHQYDFDASTVMGFLRKYGLDKEFKLNIENNHATLAARSFIHEITVSSINGMLGSVDANQGNLQCGWDTDEFSSNVGECTQVMKVILEQGTIAPGGLNFDAKLRRESTDLEDLFIAHILAMDTWALALKKAAKIRKDGLMDTMKKERYGSWESELGKKVEQGKSSLEELEKFVIANESKIVAKSGKQEKYQSIFNSYVYQ